MYVLYPFLSKMWYDGIYTLHLGYTLMCGYSVDVGEFKQFRPVFVRGLVLLELVMPVISIGILFHELIHIYDFCIFAGPAYTYWMYIFERLVSNMSRQIHDRARPERNLANNLARRIGLTNTLRILGNGIHEAVGGFTKKTKRVFEHFGLGCKSKVRATVNDGVYELPERVRGVRKSWDVFVSSANASDYTAVEGPYGEEISNRSIKILLLGFRTPEGFRIKIGNCKRACERTESDIGSYTFIRRRSGFFLGNTEEKRVGKIQDFYSIQGELFALVDTWVYYQDKDSKLNLIDFNVDSTTRELIKASDIGKVVVFAPWTGKTWWTIDKTKQCALRVRDRDHY